MRRSMRRTIAAALLILFVATAGRARAETTVTFSYSGRGGPDFAGLICNGNGSFSFADGLSTVGLADLTSFDFDMDETTPNTVSFGLADLSSFSSTVGPGLTVSSLSLATGWVQGSNQTTYRRDFNVSSLNESDASTSFELIGLSFPLTSGTVTINSVTSVPEPSTFALAVAGALTFAGCRSRRRKA